MNDLEVLGTRFRQAREDRRLSVEQVERQTRIRAKYLEAIEAGQFEAISSPVQLRGFIRNYARALGLDPDLVLAEFEEARAGKKGRQRGSRKRRGLENTAVPTRSRGKNGAVQPANVAAIGVYRPATVVPRAPVSSMEAVGATPYSPRRRGFVRTVFAIGTAAALTLLIIGGIVLALDDLTEKSSSGDDAPSILEVNPVDNSLAGVSGEPAGNGQTGGELPTGLPTQSGVVIQPPGTGNETPAFVGATQLFMSIMAQQRTWLRVTVDGNIEFEGILAPGLGVQYSARESITLRTSNAGGLKVTINNQEYRLGESRELFEQTFTLTGLITPTLPPTLTPTVSYTPSNTFTAAASITATWTSTPSVAVGTPGETSPSTATLFFTTASPGVILSPTPFPTLEPLTTSTPTPTLTPAPSQTPNITPTPSPFLPPRATRTPTLPK